MDFFVIYGLTIISLIITLIAQAFVSISYKKYSKINNLKGIKGCEAARMILNKNNLQNVDVVKTSGYLTDHYDPSKKVIRLSDNIYEGKSVGAIAVASHECGHAIQDKDKYSFMLLRSKLVPLVNFSSYAGYIAILLGVIFSSLNLIWIGIICEIVILLFQIVTLPVEINASKRALKEIENLYLLDSSEQKQGKTMLISAALTYVASVATTLIQILRLILMFTRRNN